MKVFAVIVLAIASASAKGSGPYLPSGWRPEGPAFFLPTEVKPSENPLNDVTLADSEASGSDFLREYGPPKVQEVPQNLVSQGLPDVVIEQIFDASPAVEGRSSVGKEEIVAVNTEVKTEEPSVATVDGITESVLVENIYLPLEVEVTSQSTTDNEVSEIETTSEVSAQNDEVTQQIIEKIEENSQQSEASSSVESKQEESVFSVIEYATEKPAEAILTIENRNEVINLQQVQNIPEIIASLDNENQQVEVNPTVSDVSTIQVLGALEQAPEGFLEYGPPGFAEYGPPKGASEDILVSIETNETRRRRFSPKFRSSKKH